MKLSIKSFSLNDPDEPTVDADKKETMLDILKDKILLLRLLMLCVIWFTILLTYYGESFASVGLSGNPYLNFFLSSLGDLPGKPPFP